VKSEYLIKNSFVTFTVKLKGFKMSFSKKSIFTLTALIISLLLLAGACAVRNQITVTNFSSLYQEHKGPDITGIRVFHESDSISRLYIRYRPSSLNYILKQGRSYMTADYTFSYKLFDNFESDIIRDSASYFLYDSLFYQQTGAMVYTIPVATPAPGNFILELKFSDLNTGQTAIHSVQILKDNANNAQNFLPVDDQDEVIFEEWISWKTKFRIITNVSELDNLYVDYHAFDFPPAKPPFSTEHPETYDLAPRDRTFPELKNGTSTLLQYGLEGFFHFRFDTTNNTGLTLYRFHDDYPAITDDHLLVKTLRYLTTGNEYNQLTGSDDPEAAIQEFWLKNSGNPERAPVLAQSYYDRVVAANRYFASYKEGWKTDRGMIYIVFGEPKKVYRRTDIETWEYGEAGKRQALRFDFVAIDNRFTNNDFELVRKPEYKTPYFVAVDFWRR
jgi:GWxTD domain-containing protein